LINFTEKRRKLELNLTSSKLILMPRIMKSNSLRENRMRLRKRERILKHKLISTKKIFKKLKKTFRLSTIREMKSEKNTIRQSWNMSLKKMKSTMLNGLLKKSKS